MSNSGVEKYSSTSPVEEKLLKEPVGNLELGEFCIVTHDSSVRETVDRMRASKQNCAIIVGEKTHIVGIVTDRDILTKVVTHQDIWDEPVSEVMTADPDTLGPDATAHDAMQLMENGGYRNVPVVEGDTIHGNVTHHAIFKFLMTHFPEAVYNLPPRPDNFADSRAGG